MATGVSGRQTDQSSFFKKHIFGEETCCLREQPTPSPRGSDYPVILSTDTLHPSKRGTRWSSLGHSYAALFRQQVRALNSNFPKQFERKNKYKKVTILAFLSFPVSRFAGREIGRLPEHTDPVSGAEGRGARSSKAGFFCLQHKALQPQRLCNRCDLCWLGHSVVFFPFQFFSLSSSSAWVKAAGPQ